MIKRKLNVLVALMCFMLFIVNVQAQNPLENTQWKLIEFQSMADGGTTKASTMISMRLKADGTVTMKVNCNRANGTWSSAPSSDLSNGSFEFGPLMTTKMACPTSGTEDFFMAQAQYVRGYLLKDNRLYLSLMADGGIFVWHPSTGNLQQREAYIAPEEGGPRNWQTITKSSLKERPSGDSNTVVVFDQGTILDNLGCIEGHDGIWCDVQEMGGGPRGYIVADSIKPAIAPDGAVAYGPDDSALRAGQGSFDATGSISCSEGIAQSKGQCEFGVARAGGGYATVVISKPGASRAIFFRMGIPIGSDDNMGKEFKASKNGDLHIVQIGSERYEIPDAVIFGG